MKKRIHIDVSGIGNFNTVKEAAMMANEVLASNEFYDRIAAHTYFDYSDTPPVTISRLMRASAFTMGVDLYHATSSVKNIDGYDDPENPFIVHINIWKIDRSPESICNTMIHACVHAVNAYYEHYCFGHGDNSPTGKENTAPYWIGALAQRFASEEEPIIIPLEHDHFDPAMSNIRQQFATMPFSMAT